MFEGQYNSAYKEIELTYSVKLNVVVPVPNERHNVKGISEDDLDLFFKNRLEMLQSGLQIKFGNTMQQITVEKIAK